MGQIINLKDFARGHQLDGILNTETKIKNRMEAWKMNGANKQPDYATMESGHFAVIDHNGTEKIVLVVTSTHHIFGVDRQVPFAHDIQDVNRAHKAYPIMSRMLKEDLGDFTSYISNPDNNAFYKALNQVTHGVLPGLSVIKATEYMKAKKMEATRDACLFAIKYVEDSDKRILAAAEKADAAFSQAFAEATGIGK